MPVGRAGNNKNENDKVADFDASRNLTTILLNDSQIALAIAPPISDELVPPRPTARAADTLTQERRTAAPPVTIDPSPAYQSPESCCIASLTSSSTHPPHIQPPQKKPHPNSPTAHQGVPSALSGTCSLRSETSDKTHSPSTLLKSSTVVTVLRSGYAILLETWISARFCFCNMLRKSSKKTRSRHLAFGTKQSGVSYPAGGCC